MMIISITQIASMLLPWLLLIYQTDTQHNVTMVTSIKHIYTVTMVTLVTSIAQIPSTMLPHMYNVSHNSFPQAVFQKTLSQIKNQLLTLL